MPSFASPSADAPRPARTPLPAGGPAARPGPAIAVASAATFVAFLDVTVANVALPDLRRDFAGDSLVTLSWVVAIYGVLFAALLAPAGRLADALGRKAVFLGGFAGFTLASALSAAAPSVGLLVAARALQGAGAAFMIPAALGIVLAVAAPERRVAAVGLWGATTSIAGATGPAIGGLLVDAFDWRAVFLVNVPIGVAVLWAGWRVLPALRVGGERTPDLLGSATLAAGFGLVLVAFTQTAEWGWVDGRTAAVAAAGLVLLAATVRRARAHAAPAIELDLLRDRVLAAAAAGAALYGAALFTWMLACVLFVTSLWGWSIVEAGLAVTPGAASAAVAAVVAGRVVDRRGPRPVVAVSALVFAAAGVWIVAGLRAEPEFLGFWLPVGVLAGIGMGGTTVGLTGAAARALPPARFASGTGLVMTARQLGGAAGVAALATILESSGGDLGGYRTVFALCLGATAATAVAAAWLATAAPAPPAAAATGGADPAPAPAGAAAAGEAVA